MADAAQERVLVINPGSTSTKFGLFTPAGPVLVQTARHGDEEQARFQGQPIFARRTFRTAFIREALRAAGHEVCGLSAVVGRGGLLAPLPSGTYLVDEAMVDELSRAPQGEHASNLGAAIAQDFAREAGVEAYIVDPPTVDEWDEVAHLSGTPLVEREAVHHALNLKAVAKRHARALGRPYAGLRLIVIHMGSGITVSAHREGRIVESNSAYEGPFGPDRTGSLPTRQLVRLCMSGRYSAREMDRIVFGEGGLFAYLGTRELIEVQQRIDAGDARAALVFQAMLHQIVKEAGAMAAVLDGQVDGVLLTGGMAYSERLTDGLRQRLGWMAPVTIYPGEDELLALAEGVFRVLHGEEEARRYRPQAKPAV